MAWDETTEYKKMRTQYIAYDDHGIYGIKFSASGALKNAKEFGADIKNLETAPASIALAKHVNEKDGDVGFSIGSDGWAYLIDDEGNLK